MANYEYTVVIREFKDPENGDFSPGDVLELIHNPTYLGWSEYLNDVGECFFTLSQYDQKPMNLSYLGSNLNNILNLRPHVEVWRNTRKVWSGWLGELDETQDDVIFYGYSHLSGFYDLLTPFVDKQVGKDVSTLVGTYFDMAADKTNSRVHWLTKGTIQNPWTDDSQTVGLSLPLYRTAHKRILVVFKELASYAISDTNNKVIFEVTPNGVFNFWRDRDSLNTSHMLSFPDGMIRSYRRVRRPMLRRSKLVGVGTSPSTVINQATADNGLETKLGLSEEPIYLAYVRDQTELERVIKTRAKRAGRVDGDLWMSFYGNTVVPYRAFQEDFVLGQDITIRFGRGASRGNIETKLISGQQVIFHKLTENVRLLLTDNL